MAIASAQVYTVQVTHLLVGQNSTLVNSDVGWFWIDHKHGGYTAIYPLLLAALNSRLNPEITRGNRPSLVSLVDSGENNPLALIPLEGEGPTYAKAQIDWFRWPSN